MSVAFQLERLPDGAGHREPWTRYIVFDFELPSARAEVDEGRGFLWAHPPVDHGDQCLGDIKNDAAAPG